MNDNAEPGKIRAAAEAYFRSGGYNCAESVLKALMEGLQLDVPAQMLKAASGFGGGIGGMGCTCGALTGGVMAIGLVYGRTEAGDPAVRRARELSGRLYQSFCEKHYSPYCRELTCSLEPGTPERKNQCAALTGETAYEAARLILEARKDEIARG